jgi:hypothetical protein
MKFSELIDYTKRETIEPLNNPKLSIYHDTLETLTNKLLDEGDFYRWKVDTSSVDTQLDLLEYERRLKTIKKMFREFRINTYAGSALESILIARPDLLWNMTRWRDTKEDMEVMFKSFQIFDYKEFILESQVESDYDNYSEIKQRLSGAKDCDVIVTLDSSSYEKYEDMVLRVEVLTLYANIMISVCKNIRIKNIYGFSSNYNLTSFTKTWLKYNYASVELII